MLWRGTDEVAIMSENQKKLVDFLAELSNESMSEGVYVDPENYESSYIVSHARKSDGAIKLKESGRIFIGTLDDLSFGFQDLNEAANEVVDEVSIKDQDGYKTCFEWNKKELYFEEDKLLELMTSEGEMDLEGLSDDEQECVMWLNGTVQRVAEDWAKEEAQYFVDNSLPRKIKKAQLRLKRFGKDI